MICQESSGTSKTSLTPEEVCPFPKAGPRHEHRGRKEAKSHILTNIPEKNKIELEKWKGKLKTVVREPRNRIRMKEDKRLAAKNTILSVFKQ
jgi:hypothetical protein